MRPRDLFAVGVRLFGVWMLCRGATYVASFIDQKLYPASERARDSAAVYLIWGAIDFSLAALFLLWTRTFVMWSYGEEPAVAAVGGPVDAEPTRRPLP